MTVRQIYWKTKQILRAGGIEDDAGEARLLLCHFLNMTFADIYLSQGKQTGEAGKQVLLAAKKRQAHYPLQYLLGKWPFMGLDFSVGEGVLIPRDDTEVLVSTLCEGLLDQSSPKGLDLCAGSGAVALGICSIHPDAVIEAVELYPEAFSYLTRNCQAYPDYAVTPVQGDITDTAFCSGFQDAHYGFIASNPPYVSQQEMRTLQQEIGHEPSTALLANDDGLFFYGKITELWTAKLARRGMLAVEIGETQARAVCALFQNAGLSEIIVHRDLSGNDRCVTGVAP